LGPSGSDKSSPLPDGLIPAPRPGVAEDTWVAVDQSEELFKQVMD
jgi:hypothetical protein